MELEPLPADVEAEVLATVNEYGERLEENKQLIRDWIKCQPHLPASSYDERILSLFLRGCKHSLEKTKSKLDMYYTSRTLYQDLFSDRNPLSKHVQQAMQTFQIVPLPKPMDDGYRVTIHKYASKDASLFEPRDVYKTLFMIADIRLVEEPPIVGDVFLFDVANMNAGHVAKLVNPYLRAALHCAQDGYPQRLKSIHLFNAPPFVDRAVALLKPLLKEKMRNRFHIHSTYETLYSFIPKSFLPEDYGGDLKPLADYHIFWSKKLESYKDYFQEQEYVRSDEAKRPKSTKRQDESVFGCEGAFRKLEID